MTPGRASLALAGLLLALACARVISPKGGPVDSQPPVVDTIIPSPGPGNAGLERVMIRFDERIEEGSFTPSLYPPMKHELDVSGSRAEVILSRSLDSGLVVVSLPRTLSDRRGNVAERVIELVFAAGDTLPEGALSIALLRQGGGMVSASARVDLFLEAESSLVRRSAPDTAGAALLQWLEPGRYRAVAYEDDDLNLQWDADREAGADTVFSLGAGDTADVKMVLTVLDSLPPTLIEATPRDRNHLFVLTSEEVGYRGFADAAISLTDSAGRPIEVYGLWPGGSRGSMGVILATAPMCDCRMQLRVRDFSDLMGNVREADSLTFWGTDSLPADTMKVSGTVPYLGEQDVDPYGPYQIAFTSWVSLDSVQSKLSLVHVSADTMVPFTMSRVNGRILSMEPLEPLIGLQQYRFDLDSGLVSVWGEGLDTYSWNFSPRWADVPGSISGSITGWSGSIVLQVSGAGESGEVSYHRVSGGEYLVDSLAAGRYTVAGFADVDADSSWGPGEPYGAYPGVVMVLPGTESDGIDISILP